MADENNVEESSEKQTLPNSGSAQRTEQQEQQEQQEVEQQRQPQQVGAAPNATSETVSTTTSDSAPAEPQAAVSDSPTVSSNNVGDILASINASDIVTTRAGIAPEDLDQPVYINGDISEEDQLRIASKTAAFPDIPSIPNQHATAVRCTAGEMEVAELRVKIICQEKTIMAMKMELKAAELQVEAKNKIDAKKTRLVELLDNKLQTVEKRNTKLLEMVEQMLKDKNASTDRLKEATRNMEDLSTRLVNSERTKNELTRVNTELRKMLDSIETKGSQIAKLAKEKVMKYVDANALMQQELTGLKDEAAATALQNSSEKAANYSGKASTHGDETACSELWNKIAELQKQITTALEKVDSKTATVENLQQTIQETGEANTALGLSIEQVKQKTGEGLTAFSVENEQLRALVEEFDVARKEMERKEEKSRQLVNEQKESVDAKDKEIVELKEEVQRLKGAIGQLIGGK